MSRIATPARTIGLLLLLQLASGCELVADFDRSKIPESGSDASLGDGGGIDASLPDAATSDEDAGAESAADEDAG